MLTKIKFLPKDFIVLLKNTYLYKRNYLNYSYMKHSLLLTLRALIVAVAMIPLSALAQTEVFSNSFSTQDDFNKFTIVDYNGDDHSGDGNTWQYNEWGPNAYYRYSSSNAADDWMITPELELTAGTKYVFSFNAKVQNSSYPESYAILIGQGTDVSTYKTIKAKTSVTETSYTEQSVETTIDEAGKYRFAIRCLSDADMSTFSVNKVTVTATAATASPGKVTDLSITAAADGALKATISFTAPTTTADGSELTELTKINVYKSGSLVGSVDNPTVGGKGSVEDANATEGWNIYEVKAENSYGEGEGVTDSVYVGNDTPNAPKNFTIKDNNDGTATLTWAAPDSKGVNGGYVNTDALTYTVYYESDDDNVTAVASDLTALTTNVTLPTVDDQDFAFYRVTAKTADGKESDYALVSLIVGTPYELPYAESFANGSTTHFAAGTKTGSNGFNLVTWMAVDEDGGSMIATGVGTYETVTLHLGKIHIAADAVNPTLKFYAYGIKERKAKLMVEVITPNQTKKAIKTIDYSVEEETKWQSYTLDMSEFKGQDYIVLQFRGVASQTNCTFGIDNVTLREVKSKDLGITISASEGVKTGETTRIKATVENFGADEAASFKVEFYVDGELVQTTNGSALAAEGTQTFNYDYTAKVTDPDSREIYAVVTFDGDENLDNNTSETVTLSIVRSTLPTITDLTGEANGSDVVLNWSSVDTETETVTEDFESYDDFTISNLGAWTLYDGDGERTWKPSMYPNFANAGSPMAFIVFNPSSLGIDVTDDDNAEYVPHSGNKFLAGMAANSYSTGNNDYLISERLTGQEQTITLWAKSFDASGYYSESFEVRYSTTDNKPESFTEKALSQTAATTWTEYSAKLPAGAKYFAVVYVSYDKMMLQIDDITYQKGGLKANEYNVYCDGELVGTVSGDITTFTYTPSDGNNHVYNVTAVYDEGESELSNDVSLVTTGINDIELDQIAEGIHYSVDGLRIAKDAKGIHIVKMANGKTVKLIVK